MDIQQIRILSVDDVLDVYSPKGRMFHMGARRGYGLSFCTEGVITYRQGDREYRSCREQAILLPKGGRYQLRGEETGVFALVNFDAVGLPPGAFWTAPVTQPERLMGPYRELQRLFRQPGSELRCVALLYTLLAELAEQPVAIPSTVRRAVEYMDAHLADPHLTESAVAAAAGVSETYLRRLFQRYMSLSPKQFLLEQRIKAAQRLLASHLKIADIATACGYAGEYHFSRSFKQRTGRSPSEYRKEVSVL